MVLSLNLGLAEPDRFQEDPKLLEELKAYPHRIVFETKRDGNWELYVMNADGSDPRNLTRTTEIHELNPRVSPDGQRIAFVADTFGNRGWERHVYVMNIDGSNVVRIAQDARDPCWSPDGAEIAFLPAEYGLYSRATWATKGLHIHNLASGETREHPNRKTEHLYTLSWAPGGGWFVATVHGGMGFRHSIIALEANGPAVHDLGLSGCRADLTADGTRVAWGQGDFAIGVGQLDLGGRRPRVSKAGVLLRSRDRNQTYHADWSPDGRFIVFSSGPKLAIPSLPQISLQCPGVDAPGWNLCVADAAQEGRWVALTSDGQSNKEADWLPVSAS